MLYVSRKVGLGFYGVADTDDDVEDVITRSKLTDIAYSLGIRGVDIIYGCRIGHIRPYQIPEKRTPLQLKTEMMKNIEVVIYNGMITNIHWFKYSINSPVSLRLSSFAPVCGECVLFENECALAHIVTLVLDDRIELQANSFRRAEEYISNGPHDLGVMFDIREMSDYRAMKFYGSMVRHDGLSSWEYIIDNEKRHMRAKKEIYDALR